MPIIKPVLMTTLVVPTVLHERIKALAEQKKQNVQIVTEELLTAALDGWTDRTETKVEKALRELSTRIDKLENAAGKVFTIDAKGTGMSA
jgi:hypothetical protein